MDKDYAAGAGEVLNKPRGHRSVAVLQSCSLTVTLRQRMAVTGPEEGALAYNLHQVPCEPTANPQCLAYPHDLA